MTTLNSIFSGFNARLEEPVRQHLKNVYGCLTLCGLSAAVGAYVDITAKLASSSMLASIVGVVLLIALSSTQDNGKNRHIRLGYLLGFSFCSGLGIGSLLELAIAIDPTIVITALLSSTAIFACFSISALTAKRGQWLYLGGTLMTLFFVLIVLSIANIFFGSRLLFQGYLYLGLIMMCGFVLYDTQLIIEKRRLGDKDFILHSVDLFIDLLGIFRRLVIILAQKDQKKKSRKD